MVSCFRTGSICNSEADPRFSFCKTFDQTMNKHIEVQKVDFHTAILKTILEGFAVPLTAYIQLEKILTTIGDNITAFKIKTLEKQQYWLMLTRYDWQPQIQTAQPVEYKSKDTKCQAQDERTR